MSGPTPSSPGSCSRPLDASDDSGVSIALVALFMVVLLGMAALVIDLGNGWRIRRSLIQATDSAALAAAQDFVNNQNGCGNGTAASYVGFNEAAAVMTGCTPFVYSGGEQGRVTVSADHNVQTWFSAVIGLGDYTVSSITTAGWGPPAAVTGLRPIGFCILAHPAIQAAITNPPVPPAESVVTVTYDKDDPNDCGAQTLTPGNWGVVDFNFGNNSSTETEEWIEFGYPDEVFFDNDGATSCSSELHCYPGNTGALANSIKQELDSLIASGIYFTVPIFDHVEDVGGNLMMHIMGVIRVRLIAYKIVGSPSTQFFTIGIQSGLITGSCCGGGGSGNGKVIAICGVDPNAFAACDP
jgi:Flp pilus assembly protein TadG